MNHRNNITSRDTKNCPVCKRDFTNRKKWESRGLWPAVVYRSKACRQKGVKL